MLKIPYEQVLERIKEQTGLDQEAIEAKIEQKLKDLNGLVSKEGAAHIVANEQGVTLFEQKEGPRKINEVIPGIGGVEVVGKITQIYDIREWNNERGSGKVGSFFIGDETGSIRITCWHDQTELMRNLQQGDTVRIINGYVKENQGRTEIHLNDNSKLERNPEGVEIGEVAAPQRQQAPRKEIKDLQEPGEIVEVLGTLVQSFDPRYFEICPECSKRARAQGDQFVCESHGAVQPQYGYVTNFILDDGTGTLRVVAFKEQTQQLMNKTHEQMLEMRQFPETFEAIKYDLLGQMVKVRGKVNRNEMFDRIELMSYDVEVGPSAQEELERLSQ
ncbi:DUF2240 family protein [Candidatus Woesearchaeota archaeon]|jgi:replication factor A1|nr:MAG: DUF2240 family protein [Candidatus Woesearchaeota archaeon]